MTLMRAAAVSVTLHIAVFTLLPGTGTVARPAPAPELMVWCTLAEEPAPVSAPAAEAGPVRVTQVRHEVPAPVVEPAIAPAGRAPMPAEPVLTAVLPQPAPVFTAPAAVPAAQVPLRAAAAAATPAAAPPPATAAAPVPGGDVSGGIVTVSELRARRAAPPEYPALARRRGYQGTVRVQVEVDARGLVASVAVAESSGYGTLDAAAVRAVREWTFAPVMVDGMPRAARAVVPVRFVLE